MNLNFFPSKSNLRRRQTCVKIRKSVTPGNLTPIITTNRDFPQLIQKFDQQFPDPSITIRSLKKSFKRISNLSPIALRENQKDQNTLTSPLAQEENLFFPKEPEIKTTKTLKKRAETPTPTIFARVKKTNCVFSPQTQAEDSQMHKPLKARHKGKVFKGRCEYPKASISPRRIYNINLASEISRNI